MRLRCNFTIESEGLKYLVKCARNFNKNQCFESLKSLDVLQRISQNAKYDILLIYAAATLLEIGFDKKKTYEILENLLEIYKKQLSPGNLHIH